MQWWTGQFYDNITLRDLGYVLNLGHNGHSCPNNMEESGGNWFCNHFTIIHSTGIFVHWLNWCNDEKVKDQHLQLLRFGIFPSTVIKPQSAFTFDVLDHFLIDALECKTSARSFYQKLHWLYAFPDSLPVSLSTTPCFLLYIVIQDHYHELLRVSWMWRDLSNRKQAGFGHDTERYPGPGDLTIFCPSCPQPGINLPENWREVYTRLLFFSICGQSFDYWLYSHARDITAHQYVVDGNFTVQHMDMKKPENDIPLSDGLGYMVQDGPYQTHIATVPESKEVSGLYIIDVILWCVGHENRSLLVKTTVP